MSFISKGIIQEIKDVMGVVFSRQMMMALPFLIAAFVAVYLVNTYVDFTAYDSKWWSVRLK
jgi:hypothetical protein